MHESSLTHLECPECKKRFNADRVQNMCPACQSPLLARYDLTKIARQVRREAISSRLRGLWRWAEILPVRKEKFRLTLGEGDTPLLPAERLGKELDLPGIYIKDEASNPIGTVNARGMCVALGRALELRRRNFILSTTGNAGGALAFYAARAGVKAHIFMPEDAPQANRNEVLASGTELVLVAGGVDEATHTAVSAFRGRRGYDLSTFREPYRCEGLKTMGLELAEAFGWTLPDVIIYPTGGGVGLVGMWKAFEELEMLGWIDSKRPRMVAVQSEGCAPVVRAILAGSECTEPWVNPSTIATGMEVPTLFADRLVLRVLRESGGTAVAVSEEQILSARTNLAKVEGLLVCPEGASTLAALRHLRAKGWIRKTDTIVLFNTGAGLKYI